jgi:hydroxymethylbilane synthase
MDPRPLRLGTRGSALARAQSGHVARELEARHPGLRVVPTIIETTGDKLSHGSLAAVGGKGLFVKELDEALRAGTIDVAVHSLKDVPAVLAPGIVLAAVPARADARDVLVGAPPGGIASLAPGARVGTASVRRRAQLLARRRDLDVVLLRGNVDTRLRKLRAGEVDVLVLAAAGLARLGRVEPDARPLGTDEMLPAVGQGALALACRADDGATRALLDAVADAASTTAVAAERAFLVAIGGDCNTPLAAHAEVAGDRVGLRAMVCDPDGATMLLAEGEAAAGDADGLGRRLAEDLLQRGAGALLAKV